MMQKKEKKNPEDKSELLEYIYKKHLVNDFWRAIFNNKYGYSFYPLDGTILSDGAQNYFFQAEHPFEEFSFEMPNLTASDVRDIFRRRASFVPVLIRHAGDRREFNFMYLKIPSDMDENITKQNVIFQDFMDYSKINTTKEVDEAIENGKWLFDKKYDEMLGDKQISRFLS